ncbi:hypothetical protein [Nocardiopsis sp. YSL2]|uniref:hypothetical protein n=1 Tax=Nocardiopsis sp. YSL2 TaxID=2939492 RepID=UPI0026F43686|nr:hypothetical protein [Nocardiopsis sp. YSL2]
MSAEDRLRALAAERGAVVLTEWAPERLLDIVREQRARQAATGRADAHMDGHAHEIAAAITEITGVAPDDVTAVLLAMASQVGTLLVAHQRSADSTVLHLMWSVADYVDRAQHRPDDGRTPGAPCCRCGQPSPCSISQGGR